MDCTDLTRAMEAPSFISIFFRNGIPEIDEIDEIDEKNTIFCAE